MNSTIKYISYHVLSWITHMSRLSCLVLKRVVPNHVGNRVVSCCTRTNHLKPRYEDFHWSWWFSWQSIDKVQLEVGVKAWLSKFDQSRSCMAANWRDSKPQSSWTLELNQGLQRVGACKFGNTNGNKIYQVVSCYPSESKHYRSSTKEYYGNAKNKTRLISNNKVHI